jgi:hypothetical protein
VARQAALTLKQVCRSFKNRQAIVQMGGVPPVIDLIAATKEEDVKANALEVLAAFSADEGVHGIIRQAGAATMLIEQLFLDNEPIQLYTMMTLSNLAVQEKDANQIHQQGGILALVHLLSSKSSQVQDSAIVALGNLSKWPTCRRAIIADQGLPALFALLASSAAAAAPSSNLSASTVRQLVWALAVICIGEDVSQVVLPQSNTIIPLILQWLQSEDEFVRSKAIPMILSLSNSNPALWEAFVQHGKLDLLLQLIESQTVEAQTKALAQLATVPTPELKAAFTDKPNALSALFRLLSSAARNNVLSILARMSSEEKIWPHLLQNLATIVALFPVKECRLSAVIIVGNLSTNPKNWKAMIDSNCIAKLVGKKTRCPSSPSLPRPFFFFFFCCSF